MTKKTYCIDTSALIAAWYERYKPNRFPKLWEQLDQLVTDGRLSGASGKVPSAIHVTPEAAEGGAIARIRDGDLVRLDAIAGRLEVLADSDEWAERGPAQVDLSASHFGAGRELFAVFRERVGRADCGASIFAEVVK